LGRFIIWTQSAFEKLDKIFGTMTKQSKVKRSFALPHPIMANADVTRIINSDEVQSKLNRKKQHARRLPRKLNPLRNVGALIRLNPYAQTQRRQQLKLQNKLTVLKPTKPKSFGALKPTTKKERKAAFRRMTQSFVGTSDQQGAQFLSSYNTLRSSKKAAAAQE